MSRLVMRDRRIDAFMSPKPPTVPPDEDVRNAARIMREHGVNHLLVLDGDRLVGVLDETELDLVGRVGVRGVCKDVVSVEPFVVDSRATLESVVVAMREQRASAAVVIAHGTIVGVVTVTDLLRALEGALGVPTRVRTPAEVRQRIHAEHIRIHSLLDDIERVAKNVESSTDEDAGRLRAWIRGLGDALHAHLALEEEILVPLVREADGFGEARADEMLREHAEQRATIESILEDLDSTSSKAILGVGALELVKAIRDDIREEDETFLRSDLVKRAANAH